MSSSYVIFFSSTLLKYIYIYIYILWFFMYFYKIKKFAIIEIILFNVTHLSFIFLYCLVIYIYIYIYCFVSIISKMWIIWFFNIFWSFRSLISEVLSYFFAVSEIFLQIFCKPLHVRAMASSSNCNTNWSHIRANHTMV